MSETSKLHEELALNLFRVGAILDKSRSPDGKGFRLKLHETDPSAPLSPFFLNLRTSDNPKPGPLTPEIVERIADALWQHVVEKGLTFKFNAVAGIPNAGDPIAAEFVRRTPPGRLTPRLIHLVKEEQDGKRRIARVVDGSFLGVANRVLVIDDLITRADSKLEAIEALKAAGLVVRDVLVLVDRDQGGREQLASAGYTLHAVFAIRQIVNLLEIKGLISLALYEEIIDYIDAK